MPTVEELMERLEDRLKDPAADPGGMLARVHGLGDQLRDALSIASAAVPAGPRQIPDAVVVAGMGGSAIGGDLVRGMLDPVLPVPFLVNRDYRLPGFVRRGTLVVASSYSGNTEETLSAYEQARSAGAEVIAITTGGELGRRAERDGVITVKIPAGLQPRAAIGYSLVPLLVILHRTGLLDDPAPAVLEAAELLDARRDQLDRSAPAFSNLAKQLALRQYGRPVLIYGSSGWKAAVAYRWKCQINENAKAAAYWNALPELNHNETEGWLAPPSNREVQVVILEDTEDPEPIRRRVAATTAVMGPRVAGIDRVRAEGKGTLARLMSLVQLGDYASVYLALLYGVDPTPVRAIEELKRRLAARPLGGGEGPTGVPS